MSNPPPHSFPRGSIFSRDTPELIFIALAGKLPDCGWLADQEGSAADGRKSGRSDFNAQEKTEAF